jgi:hypothetical protein
VTHVLGDRRVVIQDLVANLEIKPDAPFVCADNTQDYLKRNVLDFERVTLPGPGGG